MPPVVRMSVPDRRATANEAPNQLAAPPLDLRPMRKDASDLARFAECFARNDAARSHESLAWQYLRNPTGQLFVDLAVAGDGRIAAIYASLPVFVRIDGKIRLALQSLDTLTDVDFRGRGLFVTLAKSVFARAAASGAAFIYGFPNGNSAHGFFTKLGWTSLDPVPFLIRPLRTRYVAERLKLGALGALLPNLPLHFRDPRPPRGTELEEITRFDERFSRLWSEFAASVGSAVERDARYLNWRLADKPGERYTTLALTRGGTLRAFVTFSVKDKHGGRIGYVMELLHAPGASREARVLVDKALAAMRRSGADVALAWCLPHSPNYRSHIFAGFVPFPERFRPIELHFGARAFDPSLEGSMRRGRWYLSYLDSDTV
jgi:hypothetical protein